MLVAVVLAGARSDLVVGEVVRRLADQSLLVGQLEIHGAGTLAQDSRLRA